MRGNADRTLRSSSCRGMKRLLTAKFAKNSQKEREEELRSCAPSVRFDRARVGLPRRPPHAGCASVCGAWAGRDGRTAFAGEAQAHAVHVEVNDGRGEEREGLTHDQSSDNGEAE